MKKLFVGNIDFHSTEDDVRQLFAPFGSVERVDIIKDAYSGQPRGFGFVEMSNANEAENAIAALNGTTLGSRKLNINEAHPRPHRDRRDDFRNARRCLHCKSTDTVLLDNFPVHQFPHLGR